MPITVYGILTDAACCTRYTCNACGVSLCNCSITKGAELRISNPPIFGAIVVPRIESLGQVQPARCGFWFA